MYKINPFEKKNCQSLKLDALNHAFEHHKETTVPGATIAWWNFSSTITTTDSLVTNKRIAYYICFSNYQSYSLNRDVNTAARKNLQPSSK